MPQHFQPLNQRAPQGPTPQSQPQLQGGGRLTQQQQQALGRMRFDFKQIRAMKLRMFSGNAKSIATAKHRAHKLIPGGQDAEPGFKPSGMVFPSMKDQLAFEFTDQFRVPPSLDFFAEWERETQQLFIDGILLADADKAAELLQLDKETITGDKIDRALIPFLEVMRTGGVR